jgi:long-subunit acyl-CoA synthetase (AMP-forming)
VHVCQSSWEVGDGLLTPTHKLRRSQIEEQYQAQIDVLYSGH